MREHEVPTHVQTEDKVLLWFSFPQIVALIAVSAFSYGAYHYLPGPSGLRIALAVLIGALGVAMVVVKIGGRRLPMVAADLMKYRLGARLYVGSPAATDAERAARAGRDRPRSARHDGETGQARGSKGCALSRGGACAGCARTAADGTADSPSGRTAGSASGGSPPR